PGAARGGRRLAEERVDVDRHVRLPRTALPLVLDEPDDRRVALGERLLAREVRARRGRDGEREGGDADEERRLHAAGLDPSRSSPSLRDRNAAASCPLTLFPDSSRSGANVPRPPLPGATVTMPPPMPLLPGSPMS